MKKILLFFLFFSLTLIKLSFSGDVIDDTIAKKGDDISLKFISSLQKELSSAMKDGGTVNAIEVCSKKAFEIAKDIVKDNNAIDVRRVTEKFRNPLSRPDETDMKALRAYYNAMDIKGKLPPYVLIEKEKSYIYYKPIIVGELCLKCHGDKNQMERDVLKKINELYPKDAATGYKTGDFRGLVRVELSKK